MQFFSFYVFWEYKKNIGLKRVKGNWTSRLKFHVICKIIIFMSNSEKLEQIAS